MSWGGGDSFADDAAASQGNPRAAARILGRDTAGLPFARGTFIPQKYDSARVDPPKFQILSLDGDESRDSRQSQPRKHVRSRKHTAHNIEHTIKQQCQQFEVDTSKRLDTAHHLDRPS